MAKKTLEDISRLSGISKTVISRVLSGKAEEYRISKATVEKVLDVCRREHYQPNYLAQLLRTQTSKTIGLILPRTDYEFFGGLATTVIAEAYKHGYTVITMVTQEDPRHETEAIETLMKRQVDGIIISPCNPSADMLLEIAKELPLVLIDRYYEDDTLSYVSTNNYEGAKSAVNFPTGLGHRHILCLQADIKYKSVTERVRGAQDAAQEAGVSLIIRGDDLSRESGYVETMLALNSPTPPSAIFSLSLHNLTGAMQAIREKGLSVPDDISLITFDDSRFLDYTTPSITRIVQPTEKLCTTAFKVLSDSIAHKTSCQAHLLVSPTFCMRDSVKSMLARQA